MTDSASPSDTLHIVFLGRGKLPCLITWGHAKVALLGMGEGTHVECKKRYLYPLGTHQGCSFRDGGGEHTQAVRISHHLGHTKVALLGMGVGSTSRL